MLHTASKMNFTYSHNWRYDHPLSDEERRVEERHNKEMLLYQPDDTIDGKWSDIYWLLTEWRANSSRLLRARGNIVQYHELLKRRYLLHYYLDMYLTNVMSSRTTTIKSSKNMIL
jgi:hypothetical protein